MSDLKPCPFCGGEAHIVVNRRLYSTGLYGVECGSCPGSTLTVCHTEAEAIAAWNNRVKPPCGGGYCPLCGAAERTCRVLENDELPYAICSECGAIQPDDFTVYYCWACGARVVGE